MKKICVLIAVIMALATFDAGAYDGVSKFFVEENGDIFNTISVPIRYELINNYGRADKTEIVNDLRTDESRILVLNDEYMKIATSSAQTVELKLLHKSLFLIYTPQNSPSPLTGCLLDRKFIAF